MRMIVFLQKICISFFILQTLFFPIFASAAPNSQACRSDVKGYCVFSSSEKNKKNDSVVKNKEFAAEDFVVPGLEFLKISGNAELGDVLIKVYTYLLGLVGISALVMVIWGGIAYATATEGGVKEAKQKIANAFWGLGLALLGYLLLFTINPDLVKKFNLVLRPITLIGEGEAPKGTCIAGASCSDPLGAKDANGELCLGNSVCDANGNTIDCSVDRSRQCQFVNSGTCSIKYLCKQFFDLKESCNKNCDTECSPEENKFVCSSRYHTDTKEFHSAKVCEDNCKEGSVKYGIDCRGETGPYGATFSCTTNPGTPR